MHICHVSADDFYYLEKASWKRTGKVLSYKPCNWRARRASILRKGSLFIIVCDPGQRLHLHSKGQPSWNSCCDPQVSDESNTIKKSEWEKAWELIFYDAVTNLLFISSTNISTKYIKTRSVCVCVCVCVHTHMALFLFYPKITSTKLKPSNERREGKKSPHHSPIGLRPKLLCFPKSANALYSWSTNLGSWKYCLLVKSPTLDRPLKSPACLEIYCHSIYIFLRPAILLSLFPKQTSWYLSLQRATKSHTTGQIHPCTLKEQWARIP